MRIRALKSALALSCGLLSLAASAGAAERASNKPFADADHVIYMPTNQAAKRVPSKATNLSYHGGFVVTSAKVVFIFWGPSFSGGSDATYASTLQAFRNQFGNTAEYKVITQYSGIQAASLGSGTPDWFDTSAPPTKVTDATVQAEVNRYFSGGHGAYNSSTIYEVVTQSTSYSSSGSSTSCGGPSLAYCAYHGAFTGTSGTVLYSIEPYPSCSGCAVAGWSAVQNQEHFVCHETREAVTDQQLNAWFDRVGNEADDKCAWSPTPFIGTGGYSYQYEWSNADNACVKTR